MIGKFFYTPKPKRFNFPTRYYDPEKEEHEERVRRIKEELGIVEEKNTGGPYRPDIKGRFRQSGDSDSRSSEQARRSSNTRLIILILILALIFYLFFYSDIILF